MRIPAVLSGLLLLSIILWDAFETIILPRRGTRRFRLARLVYRTTWIPRSAIARRIRPGSRREPFLSFCGPLSLLWHSEIVALAGRCSPELQDRPRG